VLALIMALSVSGVPGFGSLLVCRQLLAELSVRFCTAQPFTDDCTAVELTYVGNRK